MDIDKETMDIVKNEYMPMPPKSRRKGYWIDKKTYDDMDKKIKELDDFYSGVHQLNEDLIGENEKLKIKIKELEERVEMTEDLEWENEQLKQKLEKMDTDIGDKGDQIASFMIDKLKQKKFEIIFDNKIENSQDVANMLLTSKWRLSQIRTGKNKIIQIGVRIIED